MPIWKQLLLIGILAAIGYGGYEGYQRYFASGETAAATSGRADRPTPIEITTAEVRTLARTVEAVGTTRARQSVDIVPEADGRIVELAISSGAMVEKGAVLVRLDDDIARADLAEAEARLKERRQALERARQLRLSNAVAEATLEEAEARLAEAEAQLDRAARRLQERTIRAPFRGVVGLTNIDPGARVVQGTTITRLDDLSAVEVEFGLPEALFAQVSHDQPLTATTVAFPDEVFHGKIEAVDNRIDPVSRSFRTRAIIPNPEGTLPAGMFMSLELTLSQNERVVIPEEALVFQAAQTYVFVVENGTAKRVVVRTGLRRDGMVAILEGVDEGSTIVLRGLQSLRDGSTVEIIGQNGDSADVAADNAIEGDNT